jgi:hypothetical protein
MGGTSKGWRTSARRGPRKTARASTIGRTIASASSAEQFGHCNVDRPRQAPNRGSGSLIGPGQPSSSPSGGSPPGS